MKSLTGKNEIMPPSEEKNYERDYSHTHCWNQDKIIPPCGILKLDHKQCCLCDMPLPAEEKESIGQKIAKNSYGGKCICSKCYSSQDKEECRFCFAEEREGFLHCPEHSTFSQSKPSWEEEFRTLGYYGMPLKEYEKLAIPFISKVEHDTWNKCLTEIEKKIEKLIENVPLAKENWEKIDFHDQTLIIGRNQLAIELLSTLQSLKHK